MKKIVGCWLLLGIVSLSALTIFTLEKRADAANEIIESSTLQASGYTSPTNVLNYVWNGASWEKLRTPNTYKCFSGQLISSETALWTPQSGKKFRVMGYNFSSTIAVGAVTIRDGAGGSTILVTPSVSLSVGNASNLPGNGILSSTINNALTMQGIALQIASGCVFGTEE